MCRFGRTFQSTTIKVPFHTEGSGIPWASSYSNWIEDQSSPCGMVFMRSSHLTLSAISHAGSFKVQWFVFWITPSQIKRISERKECTLHMTLWIKKASKLEHSDELHFTCLCMLPFYTTWLSTLHTSYYNIYFMGYMSSYFSLHMSSRSADALMDTLAPLFT